MPYKRQLTLKNEKPINSEHDLQKTCVAKLRAHNMLCFATDIFNGIGFIRDIPHKAIYKQHIIAMGAEPGQPDLIILHNKEVTFVEFKYGKGKKSDNQIACCNKLEKMGYEVLEWRTLEDCTKWIHNAIETGSVNTLKKSNEVE